jgi:hypothetical protein
MAAEPSFAVRSRSGDSDADRFRFSAVTLSDRISVPISIAVLALAALIYTGMGFVPGRVLVPLDQMADAGAWKPDPQVRVPVSNRLLSDAVLQFVPWDEASRRAIDAGRFPWSNPLAGGGRPLFANPQAALLSPFTWPRLAFGIHGWTLSVFLKLFAGGVGAWWFARSLGAGSTASAISGFVYLASGFSIVWGLHPHSNVFAVLPFLAAALIRQSERVTPGNTAVIVGSSAVAAAGGHPETLATTVVAIAAFLACEWTARRRDGMSVSRAVVWTSAPALAGLLLLGVQIVPFFHLLRESRIVEVRSEGHAAGFRAFAMAGQVLPGFLGSPLESELDLSGAVPGSENFNMRSQGFVGFVTLVVLLAGARRLAPRFRRALVVAGACLLAAWSVPPLGWIEELPFLSLMAPQYWAAPFVLFATAAAGPAVTSACEKTPSTRVGRSLILAGILFAAAGLLPSLPAGRPLLAGLGRRGIDRLRVRGFLRQPPAVYEERFQRYLDRGSSTALRRIAVPGLFWILGGFALLRRRKSPALLATAVAGELLSFGIGYLPAIPSDRIPRAPPAIRSVLELDPRRQWLIAASEDVYPPNLATFHGVRDIRSFDLLESSEQMARLRRFGYDEATRAFPSALSEEQRAALARAGVRFFLSRTPPAGTALVAGEESPAVGVYELRGAMPKPSPVAQPPDGIAAGAAISLAALMTSILLIARATPSGKRRQTV